MEILRPNISISSRQSVGIVETLKEPWVWISVHETWFKEKELKNPRFLVDKLTLCFSDTDPSIGLTKEEILFTDGQAKQILDFVEKHKDIDRIVCQCDGGISRSSGIASALSILIHGQRSDDWIFENVKFIPNMFVRRKLLEMGWKRKWET